MARRLYTDDPFGVDLGESVYALDTTTIDLCLSVFPWAPFRPTKAAVKLHTLLDLRGNIPSFIHISDGKIHEVNILDHLVPEPGAFYVMDRGFLDFARLYRFHVAGSFFVTRANRIFRSSGVTHIQWTGPQASCAIRRSSSPGTMRSNISRRPCTVFASRTQLPTPR